MIISNINWYFVSNLGDFKRVRFGLEDSTISSCGDIPILNSENLFDILYGDLGIHHDTIYRISLVFTCSDNSLYYIKEYVEFNSSYLFSEEEEEEEGLGNFFNELYNFVKKHREKTESETGLDSSVVDLLIYKDECD
jgi:hypothetical protein